MPNERDGSAWHTSGLRVFGVVTTKRSNRRLELLDLPKGGGGQKGCGVLESTGVSHGVVRTF